MLTKEGTTARDQGMKISDIFSPKALGGGFLRKNITIFQSNFINHVLKPILTKSAVMNTVIGITETIVKTSTRTGEYIIGERIFARKCESAIERTTDIEVESIVKVNE